MPLPTDYYAKGKCKCPNCKEENEEKQRYTGYYGQNWEEQRKKALSRDNNRCVECGITQKEHRQRPDLFGEGLHIHHIIPARKFESYEKANELNNLETLCANCHRVKDNKRN